MRLLTRVRHNLVLTFKGLPLEGECPSALFRDLGYVDGQVLFGAARRAVSFDYIDRTLWHAKESADATRVEPVDGSRMVVPHILGDITIESMSTWALGSEKMYVANCSRNGHPRTYSVKDLRRYHRMFSRDPRIQRARHGTESAY